MTRIASESGSNFPGELEATVSRARRGGGDKTRIVIDPGLGFGKRKEQNSEVLARLSELSQLDLPIMVGPSHKSFLAQATASGTQFATAGAVAAALAVCVVAWLTRRDAADLLLAATLAPLLVAVRALDAEERAVVRRLVRRR